MWDSYGTYVPIKQTSVTTGQPPPPPPVASSADGGKPTILDQTSHGSNYYYSPQNPKMGKNIRVNIDNAWNPVDTYIYGPTQSSIFNQENKYSGYQQAGGGGGPGGAGSSKQSGGGGNGLSAVKESLNYISSKTSKDTQYGIGSGSGGGGGSAGGTGSDKTALALMSTKGKRRLMLEIYDYETPKLCDHTAISSTGNTLGLNRLRPCSPLESYVSTGRDLVSTYFLLIYCFQGESKRNIINFNTEKFIYSENCVV